jgi:ketosteroid isomerase-like protein
MYGFVANPPVPVIRRMVLAPIFLSLLAALAVTAYATPPQTPMHRGEKHESRHEIDQLEETWRSAVLKGNTTALDALLADDYMAITASGLLQTKEQALASLRSGRVRFTVLDVSDRKVRFYGATALVTSIAEVKATTPEGDISGSYRYTRVYVRDEKGAWKIVSFEASRIRNPDQRR